MSRVQQLSADKQQMGWVLIEELARVATCASWKAVPVLEKPGYYRAEITDALTELGA